MEDTPHLLESLRGVKHFQRLSQSDLLRIIQSGTVRRFEGDQTIFHEGEACAGMFVLLRGRVHLCKYGPMGQVNILAIVEPVIMFNEVAVLDQGPNPVTAVAVEDTWVWHIGSQAFNTLIDEIPQVGLSMLRVLATRNRMLMDHYEDLSFRSVMARTAKLILDLSKDGSLPVNRRACSIEEMARRIATVPEAISRSLNAIKCQGLIKVSRTEISVLQPQRLAELAMLTLDKME